MRLPIRALQPIALRREGDPEDRWFQCVVLDVEEGRDLAVSPLIEQGEEVPVEPGSTLEVEAFLPDGIRRFRTRVRRREEVPDPRLRLEWPDEATRIQRRDAVRVRLNAKAEVLPGPVLGKPIVGLTEDLSEGGARVDVPQLPPGAALTVSIDLPGIGMRKFQGKLLRWGEKKVRGETHYWLAIQFTEMGDALRRDLTKAIFDIQRQQLRNSLA